MPKRPGPPDLQQRPYIAADSLFPTFKVKTPMPSGTSVPLKAQGSPVPATATSEQVRSQPTPTKPKLERG